MQCTAVFCSVSQCGSMLQCVAVCCSVLQCAERESQESVRCIFCVLPTK